MRLRNWPMTRYRNKIDVYIKRSDSTVMLILYFLFHFQWKHNKISHLSNIFRRYSNTNWCVCVYLFSTSMKTVQQTHVLVIVNQKILREFWLWYKCSTFNWLIRKIMDYKYEKIFSIYWIASMIMRFRIDL